MEQEYRQTLTLLIKHKMQCIEQLEKEIDINKKELLLKEILMLDKI